LHRAGLRSGRFGDADYAAGDPGTAIAGRLRYEIIGIGVHDNPASEL
jgi:hypothetical protein